MTTKLTKTLSGMPIRVQVSDFSDIIVDNEVPLTSKTAFGLVKDKNGCKIFLNIVDNEEIILLTQIEVEDSLKIGQIALQSGTLTWIIICKERKRCWLRHRPLARSELTKIKFEDGLFSMGRFMPFF